MPPKKAKSTRAKPTKVASRKKNARTASKSSSDASMVGRSLPKLVLADQDGKGSAVIAGDGYTVLYFYPKDDTPGCTREACAFRDLLSKFAKAGVRIIGVSPDSSASHARFRDKYDLPFTLLSDPDHALAKKLGVWVEKNMYGRKYFGIERSTFLVNSTGKVIAEWRKVKVDGHAEAVLLALAKSS